MLTENCEKWYKRELMKYAKCKIKISANHDFISQLHCTDN